MRAYLQPTFDIGIGGHRPQVVGNLEIVRHARHIHPVSCPARRAACAYKGLGIGVWPSCCCGQVSAVRGDRGGFRALTGIFVEGSPVDEVVFTVSRPVLPAEGTLELAEQNPGMLRLMIGGRTAKGVGESHLAARGDDTVAGVIWKKIGKQLKDLTSLGVLVVHPETGETIPARGFRFTSGAKALDASGGAMLSLTGLRMTMIEHHRDNG